MQKSKRNKILSLILSTCIIGTPTLAMASSIKPSNNNNLHTSEISHSKDFVINELYKLGFTDKEVEELFEQFPYDKNIPLVEFVPNNNIYEGNSISEINIPIILETSPGQTKNKTYYISTNWVKGLGHSVSIGSAGLGLSKATWAKIIVKKMGWNIALLAGAIASAVADMYMGPNGVRIDVTYTWAYGDNSMSWYWAPTSFNVTKY